jgi:glutamate racemase
LADAPLILVFDSGLGGLTVHAEIARARPDARFVYLADDAAFPYGPLPEARIVARVGEVMAAAIARFRPDIAVIACNTASTVVLGPLRERFAIPFVGTVPAIKPAAERSRSGMIAVLATPGTVSRDYTHDLIIRHAAETRVTLVGAPGLAALAEQALRGEPVPDAAVAAEIAPCFREKDGQRTDVVVLACTHYPLLLEAFRRLAPWPVLWLDPAEAIARRVVHLVGPAAGPTLAGPHPAVFTGGRSPVPELARALAVRRLQVVEGLTVPAAAVPRAGLTLPP